MNEKNLSDKELVILAQTKNDLALNELMERYKYIPASIVRSYFLVGGDTDDLLQEGMMGVVNAINSYDVKKGEFKTYVYSCVKNRIISCIKTFNAIKNRPLKDYISLSGLTDEGDKTLIIQDTRLGPEDIVITNESEKELNSAIKQALSKSEYQIFLLYIEGNSYNNISEKCGKTVKSVDNAVQRIKKKIKLLLRSK